jgi:hypothetical protein
MTTIPTWIGIMLIAIYWFGTGHINRIFRFVR